MKLLPIYKNNHAWSTELRVPYYPMGVGITKTYIGTILTPFINTAHFDNSYITLQLEVGIWERITNETTSNPA